jgi:hypothetical protein
VKVWDEKPERRLDAVADGFAVADNDAEKAKLLGESRYIVGATGETALTAAEMRHVKKGAVLFSASSSTVEFAVGDAAGIELVETSTEHPTRARFEGVDIELGNPSSPDHWHRVLDVDGKELLLANSGFPINLTGNRDPIAPELIQLTRSLLLLGSIQAVRLPEDARGLVDLDREGQRWIASTWMRRMRREKRIPPELMTMLEAGYEKAMAELRERR